MESGEDVPDLHAVIDAQPGHSIDVPLFGDFSPINPILEEEVDVLDGKTGESKKSSHKDGQKVKGDGGGGGNRLKRNIKHTGSLIVRKLTAARQGSSGKKEKDTAQAAAGQEAAATDKDKSGSKPEGKVAMLRTTTL